MPTLAGGSFEPPIGPAPDGNFPVGASITVKCDSENNVISFFDDETGDLDMVHSGETLTCAPHGEHPLWIHKAETKKYIHGSDMECLGKIGYEKKI